MHYLDYYGGIRFEYFIIMDQTVRAGSFLHGEGIRGRDDALRHKSRVLHTAGQKS